MKASRLLLAASLLQAATDGLAEPATNAPTATLTLTNPPSLAPAVLPSKGLGQHDFFYAGEAKNERQFLVGRDEIVWSY